MGLHDDLLAAVTARQERARAASPGPWHLNAEHDEVWAVDDELVADAHALTGNQTRATAAHIAAEDPATVLRHCERDLKVLGRHRPAMLRDASGHVRCRGDHFADVPFAVCVEIRDLAAAYAIDIEETS